MVLKQGDANKQTSPLELISSVAGNAPALAGVVSMIKDTVFYFLIQKDSINFSSEDLPQVFLNAEKSRKAIADQIQINTPDSFINTIGGALNIAETDDAKEATSLAVVPNPIKSSSASASFNLVKQGNVTIKVTDLSGRLFISQDVRNAQVGKNTVALSGLSKLNNGIFMMVAEQNGVIVGRTQLVISR